MFKIAFVVICIIAAFTFIMIKSEAWHSQQEWMNRGGVRVYEPVTRVDWDKFFAYINSIPENISKNIRGFIPKKQEKHKSRMDVRVDGKKVNVSGVNP